MNNKEFKVKKFKESTVYTLESASAGGTSAGGIASVAKPVGSVQRRTGDNFFTPEDADPIKPRRGPLRPQTGGGEHKDRTKTIPRKEKHKKPMDMSETARLSPAAKLQRAFDREQAKSSANRNRGEEVMSQARAEWEKKQANEKSKKTGVAEGSRYTGTGIHPKLVEVLKQRGYKGPYQLGKLKKWFVHLKDDVGAQPTDEIMVTGNDVEYDEWVLREQYGEYAFGSESGYMTGNVNRVIRYTAPIKEQSVAEGRHEFDKKTGQMNYTTTDADQRHGLYINGKLVKTYNSREACDNVKRRDPRFKDATVKKIAEATGDKPFDSMMTTIKKGPSKDVKEDDEYNEYSDEVDMTKNNLLTIIRACKALDKTMKSGENLPEWVEEKVSMSKQNMVTVAEYLQSQHEQGHVYDEDHSTATGGWGQASKGAIYRSGELAGAGHDERMMEDGYVVELSARLGEKLAKNAPVKAYIDDFAKAAKTPNAKGHHQFKNKSPEKVRQMAMAASYGAKNPSKRK